MANSIIKNNSDIMIKNIQNTQNILIKSIIIMSPGPCYKNNSLKLHLNLLTTRKMTAITK